MTKSKSSASSVVVPSTVLIQLENDTQFLNATLVTLCPIIAISTLTRM